MPRTHQSFYFAFLIRVFETVETMRARANERDREMARRREKNKGRDRDGRRKGRRNRYKDEKRVRKHLNRFVYEVKKCPQTKYVDPKRIRIYENSSSSFPLGDIFAPNSYSNWKTFEPTSET